MVSFYICRYFWGFTGDVAKQQQGTSKDVLSACDDISSTITVLLLHELMEKHDLRQFSKRPIKQSELSGEQITIPRRCTYQTHRSNHPADTPEEFGRRYVYIPFPDHLVCELNSRFNQLSTTALSGLCLLNGVSANIIGELKEAFSSDIPSADSFQQ